MLYCLQLCGILIIMCIVLIHSSWQSNLTFSQKPCICLHINCTRQGNTERKQHYCVQWKQPLMKNDQWKEKNDVTIETAELYPTNCIRQNEATVRRFDVFYEMNRFWHFVKNTALCNFINNMEFWEFLKLMLLTHPLSIFSPRDTPCQSNLLCWSHPSRPRWTLPSSG